jgi:hypothetical protein
MPASRARSFHSGRALPLTATIATAGASTPSASSRRIFCAAPRPSRTGLCRLIQSTALGEPSKTDVHFEVHEDEIEGKGLLLRKGLKDIHTLLPVVACTSIASKGGQELDQDPLVDLVILYKVASLSMSSMKT